MSYTSEPVVVRLRALESDDYRSGRSLHIYRKEDREPETENGDSKRESDADGELLTWESGPRVAWGIAERYQELEGESRTAALRSVNDAGDVSPEVYTIILEVHDDFEDEDSEPYHIFELESDAQYTIYWLYLEPLNCKSWKLSGQPSLERAELYAKLQYYHHTGDYPFIVSGMTSAYKSEGSRPEVETPDDWDDLCDEVPELSDSECGTEWLLIMHKDRVYAHSLNQGEKW